jgi:hypothetical protein
VPPSPPPPRSLPPPPRGQRRRDQWTCAGVPRHHGDLLATARNKMATAPPDVAERWRQNLLPLGLLFVPETPDQRSNSFQSCFSFAESFNEPRYLFPDAAPTGLPEPNHVRRDSSPRRRAASRPTSNRVSASLRGLRSQPWQLRVTFEGNVFRGVARSLGRIAS